jgi:hypothetical protein
VRVSVSAVRVAVGEGEHADQVHQQTLHPTRRVSCRVVSLVVCGRAKS